MAWLDHGMWWRRRLPCASRSRKLAVAAVKCMINLCGAALTLALLPIRQVIGKYHAGGSEDIRDLVECQSYASRNRDMLNGRCGSPSRDGAVRSIFLQTDILTIAVRIGEKGFHLKRREVYHAQSQRPVSAMRSGGDLP